MPEENTFPVPTPYLALDATYCGTFVAYQTLILSGYGKHRGTGAEMGRWYREGVGPRTLLP
jgi:hypothetical protein